MARLLQTRPSQFYFQPPTPKNLGVTADGRPIEI